MVRRVAIWIGGIIGISTCKRVKVCIHPVIELPIDIKCKAGREVESCLCTKLCLRRIRYRDTVAPEVHLIHLKAGVLIIDDSLHIIGPLPFSKRGKGAKLQQIANTLIDACLNTQMERIQAGYHIARIIRIHLLVFVGHKGLVLPIGGISGKFASAICPYCTPTNLAKQILLILHPLCYLIVSRCKPDVAVWQPAVPACVGVELVGL